MSDADAGRPPSRRSPSREEPEIPSDSESIRQDLLEEESLRRELEILEREADRIEAERLRRIASREKMDAS